MLIAGTPMDDHVPSGKLASVVHRAILRDPARRHQSAAELLAAIEAAVAPDARWEPPAEKERRLRQQLAAAIDLNAVIEIIDWADVVAEGTDTVHFAPSLSAVHWAVVQDWWKANPANFKHAFGVFAQALDYLLDFDDCDPLANFARLAVTVTPTAG
jgi:hypothetical protein